MLYHLDAHKSMGFVSISAENQLAPSFPVVLMELRALKGGEGDAPTRSSQMELKEPQALHLQAVKFNIHREAAQPDLGGANPTQTVPNVSPPVREHRYTDSSDPERRSVPPSLPNTSGILRDSSRPSQAAPSGRRLGGRLGSSLHAALLSAAEAAAPQPCEAPGEGPKGQNSAISEKSTQRCRGQGRAPALTAHARAGLAGRVWRASGTEGRAAPGPCGALRAALVPGGAVRPALGPGGAVRAALGLCEAGGTRALRGRREALGPGGTLRAALGPGSAGRAALGPCAPTPGVSPPLPP